MDVSAVHHGGTLLRYSASLLGYGFYGDIIRDSEKKRWMGLIRYDFSGGSAGRGAPVRSRSSPGPACKAPAGGERPSQRLRAVSLAGSGCPGSHPLVARGAPAPRPVSCWAAGAQARPEGPGGHGPRPGASQRPGLSRWPGDTADRLGGAERRPCQLCPKRGLRVTRTSRASRPRRDPQAETSELAGHVVWALRGHRWRWWPLCQHQKQPWWPTVASRPALPHRVWGPGPAARRAVRRGGDSPPRVRASLRPARSSQLARPRKRITSVSRRQVTLWPCPLSPAPRPEDLSVPSLLRRDGVLPPGTAHRGVPEGREALPSRVSARPPCLPLVAWRGVAWAGRVGRYFPDTLGPAHTHPERSRHASPATVRVPRMGLGGGGQRGGEATAPPGAGPPSRRCPRRGSEG